MKSGNLIENIVTKEGFSNDLVIEKLGGENHIYEQFYHDVQWCKKQLLAIMEKENISKKQIIHASTEYLQNILHIDDKGIGFIYFAAGFENGARRFFQKYLDALNTETDKFNFLVKLSGQFSGIDSMETWIFETMLLYDKAQQINIHYNLGLAYSNTQELAKAKKHIEICIQHIDQAPGAYVADIFMLYSEIFESEYIDQEERNKHEQPNRDKALQFAELGYKHAQNPEKKGEALYNRGFLHYAIGDFETGLQLVKTSTRYSNQNYFSAQLLISGELSDNERYHEVITVLIETIHKNNDTDFPFTLGIAQKIDLYQQLGNSLYKTGDIVGCYPYYKRLKDSLTTFSGDIYPVAFEQKTLEEIFFRSALAQQIKAHKKMHIQ